MFTQYPLLVMIQYNQNDFLCSFQIGEEGDAILISSSFDHDVFFLAKIYDHFLVVLVQNPRNRLPNMFLEATIVFGWYLCSFLDRNQMLMVRYFSSAQPFSLTSSSSNSSI